MLYPNRFIRAAFLVLLAVALAGCGANLPQPQAASPTILPSQTSTQPADTATPTETMPPTVTATLKPTATATITETPTPAFTDTPAASPTPSPSATFAAPTGKAKMQAYCRYGPGTAYLFSAGLYPGDQVMIDGRSAFNNWLYVKPANLDRHCWTAPGNLEISGDVSSLPTVVHQLPRSGFVINPQNVRASRSGSQVTVTWDPFHLSEDKDRGYLLEVTLCQNGARFWTAVQTNEPTYTFPDDASCGGKSSGQVYIAEKHGYSDPVQINWP